jgi:hypothetical protein
MSASYVANGGENVYLSKSLILSPKSVKERAHWRVLLRSPRLYDETSDVLKLYPLSY